MSAVDWISVLKLDEFQIYFNTHELQKLSMVSTKFRTTLINTIFRIFNFKKFVFYRKYCSYFINEENFEESTLVSYSINPYKPLNNDFISSRDKFKLDLKEFLSYPSQLIISNCNDYGYLLYIFPKTFLNISSITISYSQLQFELFQYILDSLNYLETIELLSTQFIQYTQNSVQTPINWPATIKKLKLKYNELCFAFNKETPIRISEYGKYMVPRSDLVLSFQNLPNLTSLEYRMFGHTINNDDITSFLKLNQQIIYLNIEIFNFNLSLFNAIKSLRNLSHLSLNVIEFKSDEFQGVELQVLDTVTNLSTSSHSIIQNQSILFDIFPKLTKLTIKIDKYTDEYTLSLLQNLTRINSLKLDICYALTRLKKLTFPKLDNLISLEFKLSCIRDININDFKWNAEACPSLKLIKFKKFINLRPFEEPKLCPWMANDWKIVYYPLIVTFHRLY